MLDILFHVQWHWVLWSDIRCSHAIVILILGIDIRCRMFVLIWDDGIVIGYRMTCRMLIFVIDNGHWLCHRISSLLWHIDSVFGFDIDIAYWYCLLRLLPLGIDIDIGYWYSARWVSEATYKRTRARCNINTRMQCRVNIQYQYTASTPISNNISISKISTRAQYQ